MADPIRHVSLCLPLRVVHTVAGFQIKDRLDRTIHFYAEDDGFRRSALPHYWLTPDAKALAVWIARKLTDAIESGELVAVDRVELQEGRKLDGAA